MEKRSKFFYFFLSLAIVALGQPSWVTWLGPVAAVCGYALFWKGLLLLPSLVSRFFLATFWYTLVQLIQLSWMTSIEFQGIYILYFYAILAFWLGAQFGLLSLLLPKKGNLPFPRILAMASLWALIEWTRYYFLCGFSWNPAGLALCSSLYSLQLASVWGVLGLSFWVMLVNACTLNLIHPFYRSFKNISMTLLLAAFPYLFGLAHISYHDREVAAQGEGEEMRVALIQTGLLHPQKLILPQRLDSFISPWEQWRRIIHFLRSEKELHIGLIVFPEVALPFQCEQKIYPLEEVVKIFETELGPDAVNALPRLASPYAEKRKVGNGEQWMVSNSFWTQGLANYFHSEVVIGFEDRESQTQKSYNAAFHFLPHSSFIRRYEKQVLLPLAEYLPFKWCLPFVKKYGIAGFFTPGQETKVFHGSIPLSISICYEETFPDLIREGRLKGAELLVNVTNDNWYPFSRLPKQHFDLSRLRAIENGAPLARACNTGVSAMIDSLGRPLCTLCELDEYNQPISGALISTLPLYHFKTFYTYWGDGGIVGLSLLCLGFFLRRKNKQ